MVITRILTLGVPPLHAHNLPRPWAWGRLGFGLGLGLGIGLRSSSSSSCGPLGLEGLLGFKVVDHVARISFTTTAFVEEWAHSPSGSGDGRRRPSTMMKLGFDLGVALLADAVLDTREEPVVRLGWVVLGHSLEEVQVPFHQGGAL